MIWGSVSGHRPRAGMVFARFAYLSCMDRYYHEKNKRRRYLKYTAKYTIATDFFNTMPHRSASEMIPDFPKNLRKYMGRSGLTQEQLAEKAYISIATLKGFLYKRENDPRISTLINLASALDCTVNDLIGYRKEKRAENARVVVDDIKKKVDELNAILADYYK